MDSLVVILTTKLFIKVDGTMPTVVGLERATSVRSTPETSTPLLHLHSPGRETAPQVTYAV